MGSKNTNKKMSEPPKPEGITNKILENNSYISEQK